MILFFGIFCTTQDHEIKWDFELILLLFSINDNSMDLPQKYNSILINVGGI